MKEHVLGPAKNIPVGEFKIFEVANQSIGIFNIDGSYHALRNYCPHQGGPACETHKMFDQIEAEALEDGNIREYVEEQGCVIACPWHGIEFDARTGECLTKKEWKIRKYDIDVDADGNLVIKLNR
jgi:nitrite reductase (NADH) small subunit